MSRQLTSGVLGRRKVSGISPNYIYGLLYNWWAGNDERIGNSGFDVPTDAQWAAMRSYVNTNYNVAPNNFGIGNHLKSCRQVNSPLGGDCDTTVHPRWGEDVNNWGRNTLNFSGLAGGIRIRGSGNFTSIGGQGLYRTKDLFKFYFLFLNNNDLRNFTPDAGTDGLSLKLSRLATVSELSIAEGAVISNYYKGNNNFLYDCIRIDDRVWTVQNLAETKWSDGTDIPFTGANGVNYTNGEWIALTTPGVCAYDNDIETWAYTL